MNGLLQASGLARSTFYYQQKALQVVDKHASLKTQIKSVFEQHKGRYGYRRITAAIGHLDTVVNHKKIQRLMGQLQLKSLVRPKRYRAYKGPVGRIAPNHLARGFEAEQPNQKWVTDITEFKVAGVKLYLSPVLDLYNGEIAAYQMETAPRFSMVSDMLKKALSCLKAHEKPMLHSDQGWHYQMAAYRRQLEERELSQSMSRKGNCYDNATMESFFGTLKTEFYYLNRFTSVDQLKAGLDDYIHYYNHDA